jgi:hypothetical protein
LGGDVVAVVWKPNAFVPKPFKLANANLSIPIGQVNGKFDRFNIEKGKATIVVPNIFEILSDFSLLGEGLVEAVKVQ